MIKLFDLKYCLVFSFLLFFAALVAFSFWHVKKQWTQGDEPHYLIITQSLISDYDLELKNNYQNLDYFQHHAYLIEDPHVTITEHGDWYSVHNLLLPLMLVPGYLIGGRLGAVLIISLFSLGLLLEIFIISRKLGASKKWSLILTATTLLSGTYLMWSTSIYPDIIFAYFYALVFRLLFLEKISVLNYYLSGIIAGISVFLHVKSIILFIPLFFSYLLFLYFNKTKLKNIIQNATALFLPWLIFILFLIIFNKHYFNSWSLSAAYGSREGLFLFNPLINIMKALTDQEQGLLINFPIVTLALICLPISIRLIRYQKLKLILLIQILILIIYYLITMSYRDWYGGFAPAARYFCLLIPVFIPLLSLVMTKLRSILIQVLFIFTTLVQILLLFLLFYQQENPGFPDFSGKNKAINLLSEKTGWSLSSYLPHFFNNDAGNILALVYIFIVVFLSTVLYFCFYHPAKHKAS